LPRPDPALLDAARYPFHCEIETRYRDLDSNLHINNGVMASLLEEGRVRFHRASSFGASSGGMTAMVVSLAVEFLGQSHFPDPLEIHVAVSHIGRTSYRLDQLVTQRARTVAYAQATLVCMLGDGPIPVPDQFRHGAERWMLLP
jgi:acyl-CoA thioester hydrolase